MITLPRVSYENLLSRVRAGAAEPEVEDGVTEVLEVVSEVPVEAQMRDVPVEALTRGNLYQHPSAHPLVLLLGMVHQYGAEWLLWEPETVRFATHKDLGPMSDLNFHKLMAGMTLFRTNAFWKKWEVFTHCTMPFNGFPPDFDVHQVPTVADILVSVEIAKAIRDDVDYSSEVRTYLETVYRYDGLFVHLAPVTFVSLPSKDLPFNDVVVHSLWPRVRKEQRIPATLGAGERDQLQRMLLAYNHLELSRSRLRAQLPMVTHAL